MPSSKSSSESFVAAPDGASGMTGQHSLQTWDEAVLEGRHGRDANELSKPPASMAPVMVAPTSVKQRKRRGRGPCRGCSWPPWPP